MKALLQRVHSASVGVQDEIVGKIKRGWLLLLGVGSKDSEADVLTLSKKIINLRAFSDEEGKMNLSLKEVGGEILLISQFTLYANCIKGRRPSFTHAAPVDLAKKLYLFMGENLKNEGIPVQWGRFGSEMQVSMCGHGPVTLLLNSKELS